MRYFRYWVILMAFWTLMEFKWDPIMMGLGLLLSGSVVFITQPRLDRLGIVLPGLMVMIRYLAYLIVEIMIASVQHMIRILSREEERVISFELKLENGTRLEWVMMANLITLTPGTLTLDIGERTLKVLAVESSFRKQELIEKNLLETYHKIFG